METHGNVFLIIVCNLENAANFWGSEKSTYAG